MMKYSRNFCHTLLMSGYAAARCTIQCRQCQVYNTIVRYNGISAECTIQLYDTMASVPFARYYASVLDVRYSGISDKCTIRLYDTMASVHEYTYIHEFYYIKIMCIQIRKLMDRCQEVVNNRWE